MTVEMTPFDALSLLEGLSSAIIHLEYRLENEKDNIYIQERGNQLINDARLNYKEIDAALRKRNDILDGKEVIV